MELQNQERKKCNAAVCIICSKQAYSADNNQLYTKLLIDEFIGPSEKAGCRFKTFDFCIDCLETMEHLHDLQDTLNYVQKMIKEKKTEITIKILNSKYEYSCVDEISFRKISTRDFCPIVEMSKNNRLRQKLNKNSSNNVTDEKHSSKELPSTKIDKLLRYRKLDSNSNKKAKQRHSSSSDSNEDNRGGRRKMSDDGDSLSQPMNLDAIIRSDLICIEPKHKLPFNEEESAVEFEPWKEYSFNDDDDCTNSNEMDIEVDDVCVQVVEGDASCNSNTKAVQSENVTQEDAFQGNNDEESNSCFELIDIDDDDEEIEILDVVSKDNSVRGTGQVQKIWEQPPLKIKDMCTLAILISKNMQLPMSGILAFISDNFPYYQPDNMGNWMSRTRVSVNNSISTGILQRLGRKYGRTMYVLNKTEKTNSYQQYLRDKLFDQHLLSSMAFPDRISSFRELTLRPIPEIADFPNYCHVQTEVESLADTPDNPGSNIANTALNNAYPKSSGRNNVNIQDVKIWQKPHLSFPQLIILAMLSTEDKSMRIAQIQDFVSINFPYFESVNCREDWKQYLRIGVCSSKFITRIPCEDYLSQSRFIYALKSCDKFHRSKERLKVVLNEELSSTMECMAFPERISSFRDSLMRDISGSSTSNDVSDVCFRNVENGRSKEVNDILSTFNISAIDRHETLSQSHDNTRSCVPNGKVWDRPPISILHLCILAIMCSTKIQLKISEIDDFISYHFPHFISNNSRDKWKKQVRFAVCQSPYIGRLQNSNNVDQGFRSYSRPYTVLKSHLFDQYKQRLFEKLQQNTELLNSMAFPEQLSFFRNSLMKEIPERTETTEVGIGNSQNVDLADIYYETEEEKMINRIISDERLAEALREDVEDAVEIPKIEPNFEISVSHGLTEDTVDVLLSSCFGEDNSSSSVTLTYNKTWSKPILTYEQLCIIAIMNRPGRIASFQDIYCFVTENFPFYKTNVQSSCEVIIKKGLSGPRITAFLPGNSNCNPAIIENDQLYAVREEILPDNIRIAISQILSSAENLATMEYPDRVQAFIKNVMTRRMQDSKF